MLFIYLLHCSETSFFLNNWVPFKRRLQTFLASNLEKLCLIKIDCLEGYKFEVPRAGIRLQTSAIGLWIRLWYNDCELRVNFNPIKLSSIGISTVYFIQKNHSNPLQFENFISTSIPKIWF